MEAATTHRPNIVFVFADEWPFHATGYNGDTNCETPVLDDLASQSVNVSLALSGCPVCSPYRASLMTGQRPLTHGVYINDIPIEPDCHSIARVFGAAGYDTAYIGKWHVYGSPGGVYDRRQAYVPRDCQLGFDYWKGFEASHDYNNSGYYFGDDPTLRKWDGYDAFAQSHDAAQYIRDHTDGDRPFLLMLSWGPPHFPLHSAPEEYRARFADRDIVLRPNVPPEHRERAADDLRGCYAHIAALDDCLAIVRGAVRQSGAEDNTIFVFTADHGDMFQSHGLERKQLPWDESIRVPFLLRWPAGLGETNRETPIPLDAPDIMPTLLGLCGLEAPPSVEGRDWSAQIRGEVRTDEEDSALLSLPVSFSSTIRACIGPYRGLRSRRYTYVRNENGPWLLYDNNTDPYQMNNLIDNAECEELRRELDAKLQARLDAAGDEFLPGSHYLQRDGWSHYRETQAEPGTPWRDPFQQ